MQISNMFRSVQGHRRVLALCSETQRSPEAAGLPGKKQICKNEKGLSIPANRKSFFPSDQLRMGTSVQRKREKTSETGKDRDHAFNRLFTADSMTVFAQLLLGTDFVDLPFIPGILLFGDTGRRSNDVFQSYQRSRGLFRRNGETVFHKRLLSRKNSVSGKGGFRVFSTGTVTTS